MGGRSRPCRVWGPLLSHSNAPRKCSHLASHTPSEGAEPASDTEPGPPRRPAAHGATSPGPRPHHSPCLKRTRAFVAGPVQNCIPLSWPLQSPYGSCLSGAWPRALLRCLTGHSPSAGQPEAQLGGARLCPRAGGRPQDHSTRHPVCDPGMHTVSWGGAAWRKAAAPAGAAAGRSHPQHLPRPLPSEQTPGATSLPWKEPPPRGPHRPHSPCPEKPSLGP